jgi:hypothetical protein
MIQEKLNSLRPYVTGLRFVKDLPVVDLVIKEGWNMFESDKVSYKPSANNKNYFMVFPKDPKDSIDDVVTHVEHIIDVNIEKENKLVLLKAKIEELKQLFTDKSLKDLERLKYVFPDLEEPTLKDIDISQSSRHVPTKVELPPKPNKGKFLEKEEI